MVGNKLPLLFLKRWNYIAKMCRCDFTVQGEEVEVKCGHVKGEEKASQGSTQHGGSPHGSWETVCVVLTSLVTVGPDRSAQLKYRQEKTNGYKCIKKIKLTWCVKKRKENSCLAWAWGGSFGIDSSMKAMRHPRINMAIWSHWWNTLIKSYLAHTKNHFWNFV